MHTHTKKVIFEVSVIIGIWCAAAELLVFIFIGIDSRAMLGLLLGSVMAVAAFIHMGISLENSIDLLEEEPAKKNTIKTFIARAVSIAAVMAAAIISGWFNMLFVIIGMFGLKVGAYAQPFVDKIFSKLPDRRH